MFLRLPPYEESHRSIAEFALCLYTCIVLKTSFFVWNNAKVRFSGFEEELFYGERHFIDWSEMRRPNERLKR